jgi:hypothetical protein
MSTKAGIFAITGLFLVFLGFGYFLGYIGFRNAANQSEQDIVAQYEQAQNVYDNGWKAVVEVAQVPKLQEQNYKDLYDGVMKGRYGANGSQALFQFIKEQNPKLSDETYTKIQRTIETFHANFEASQQDLVAKKQSYRILVTATTDSLLYNGIGHFPHIKVGIPTGAQDDYAIVTSDKTQNDFKSKKANPIDLGKGTNQ